MTHPPQGKYTVGIIQMTCSADPAANTEKAIAKIREAAKLGANVICTQELFRSQYFCQVEDTALFDLAEPIPGPTTHTLSELAKELNVAIVASLFERRAAGLYHNTAAILDADGSLLGTYRKMHIPDDPLYYEKYYFTPGDAPSPNNPADGFKVWQTKFGQIGVLICWDQWYPEAARLTAMQDCSILFYPTAIGWHPKEKSTFGETQATPGKRSNAPTPSPTASTSPRPTASASKKSPAAARMASNSSAEVSSATPSEKSCKKPPAIKKKSSSPKSTPTTRKKPAATGPSSATGGLMHMEQSPKDSASEWIKRLSVELWL